MFYRRNLRRCVAALLIAVASPAVAYGEDSPQPAGASPAFVAPVLHLKGGRWFDGRSFRPMEWYAVDGRLTQARPARIDATIDLSGRHVLPPLAEAHNHDLQNAFYAHVKARDYLARGIFYTGQLAGSPSDIAGFRGFLSAPGTVDAAYSEALISSSDGHPLGMALASYQEAGLPKKAEELRDTIYWSVDTPADLDARWERIAASKPALIKVILIDSANYAANRSKPELFGKNGIDPALLPEIVTRGHAIGARVVAHADTAADFANAVRGGADIIAHLPGYRIAKGKTPADYRLSDVSIAEAARRGVTVITTTAASRYAIQRQPETEAAIMANYADNVRRLRNAGVKLALGSDMFEGSVLDEIETVDRLNVLPRPELLRIATADTARLLFPNRVIGAFAEGAEASLIAVDGDPLKDLGSLRRVRLAIKQGELLAAR